MEDSGAERWVTLGVVAVAGVIGLALVTLGPGSGSSPWVRASASAPITAPATAPTGFAATTTDPTTVPATTVPTSTTAATTSTVDPGSLPQTLGEPTASGATFNDGVHGLWNAIVQDQPALAMPLFFPKAAYLQVKAIADPATDYEQRLIANYAQDIHTLHAQLGGNASAAQFTGIDVPQSQAVLVQPGEESNKLSYWRVYGTVLRYTLDGTAHTFPVTSLISWRGEWYVVHLGEIR